MSGFEIAGVVLGSFPLAIAALDKYREVARLWGFWYEIRSEYQKCSNEVKYHRLCFSRNLKQLLLPMVADKVHIQRLIAEPGGNAWKEPSVAQQLQDRLQDSYELYSEIMQQLQRTMEDLNKELALDKEELQKKIQNSQNKKAKSPTKASGTVWHRPFGKVNREYELYRLSFAIGESKRKELFDELKEYNERLEKLLTTSDVIAQLETKPNQTPKTARPTVDSAVAHFWRHADRLYKVLSRAWNCACASRHRAKIILQHRTLTDLDFMLLFLCHTAGHSVTTTPWRWRETRIKLLDPPPIDKLFTTITFTPSGKENLITNQKSLWSNSSSNNSTAQSNSKKQSQQAAPNGEIHNLCERFAMEPSVKSGYGFLEDDHKRYHIYPASSDHANFKMDDSVTLDDLLRNKHKPGLSRRQRYTLALTLASSFLQLRESAWLNSSSWSKSDISFLRDADNDNVLLLDRPFVMRPFSSGPSAQSKQADGVSSVPLLGVLLLELCFGSLIEEHPSRQKCPAGDAISAAFFDQLAAVEWLREVGDEAGPDFACAAEWCLLKSRTLSGGEWRRLLFENVVQPLERCHLYLNPSVEGPALLS